MILELLKRITQSLDNKEIPYMLSGSIALNNYTIPRMTMDIDIIIALRNENLDEFLSIFRADARNLFFIFLPLATSFYLR